MCIGGWINQGSHKEIRLMSVPRCLSRSTEFSWVKHQCLLVHRHEHFSFFFFFLLGIDFGNCAFLVWIHYQKASLQLVWCVYVCVCVCLKIFSHWQTCCEVIQNKSWFTPLPWQWEKDLHLYQECWLRIVLQFRFGEGNSVAWSFLGNFIGLLPVKFLGYHFSTSV